jgi:exonuclease III
MIGDFNTGLKEDAQGTPFLCGEYMETLLRSGWTDAWRSLNPSLQEYSWFSTAGNGFRLDHVFATQTAMHSITSVQFNHLARESGASDHSALLTTVRDL